MEAVLVEETTLAPDEPDRGYNLTYRGFRFTLSVEQARVLAATLTAVLRDHDGALAADARGL